MMKADLPIGIFWRQVLQHTLFQEYLSRIGATLFLRSLLILLTIAGSITRTQAQTCSDIDFSTSIVIGTTPAPNTWYTDRYAPAGFVQATAPDGVTNTLKHSISDQDCQTCRPSGFQVPFYNTQGRTFQLPAGSRIIETRLFIPTGWAATGRRMAGFWGTAYNNNGSFTNESYPIIEYASDGSGARFQGYESGATGDDSPWINMNLPQGFTENSWVTLKIELLTNKQYKYTVTAANGNFVTATTTTHQATTDYIGSYTLQGYNTETGVSYDIYWDDLFTNTNVGLVTNVNTGKQFCTIQAAIDDAATLDGHTINVPAGVYTETVTITKALKINGAQYGIDPRPSKSTTRATPSEESIISVAGTQKAVNISHSDVEFNGFTVKHSTTSGNTDLVESAASATPWENIKIANNILTSSRDEGVQLRATSNSIIEKNYITNTAGDGINMSGSPSGVGNIIQDNEIVDAKSTTGGIYLYGIKGVTVRNNYIHGNTIGMTVGVIDNAMESVQDIEIHHNKIVGAFLKLSMTNVISIGGTATSNVNVHNNYIEELAGTATNVALVRIANNVTNVKVNNNYFKKQNDQQYLVLGFDDDSRIPTTVIDASCNWYGNGTFAGITGRMKNTPVASFIPYLTSGTNTLAADILGFEPEANFCSGPVFNVQKAKYYTTITAGIADADPTNTLKLGPETFSENVVINKPLTIIGSSAATTQLTGSSGYGIYINADNVSIQDLTVNNAPLQGILTNCGSDNITLTNVAVTNSGKTGFNINGVNTAVLNNIVATGNKGNGVSLTDSKNITINGLTSSNNAFTPGGFGAGIGIFSNGACASTVTPGTENVQILGSINIGESVAIYQQGQTISNITYPAQYTHQVGVGANEKYYATSKANAYSTLVGLTGAMNTKYVQEIASGNLYVNADMSIQTAINLAEATSPAKTVFVEAGTFSEKVLINKSLTLAGASTATTILNGAVGYGIYVDADNVTIQDLTVNNSSLQGLLTNCGSDNLTITNVAVTNSGKTGFNINGVNTAVLNNIVATGNKGNGVSISDSKNVTVNGLTSSGNAFAPGGFGAGIGIFSNGACASIVTAGTSNVTIQGTINISESVQVYQQGEAISNVTYPPAYTYLVGVGASERYYATSKANAYLSVPALTGATDTKYVKEIASGNLFVNAGMSIQAAINAAEATSPAKTVYVEAGTYGESVLVNKTIKLLGAKAGIDPRASKNSSRVTPAEESIISLPGDQKAISISSSDVVLDGFTVNHNTTSGEADLISTTDDNIVKNNLLITNNIIHSSTDEGIQIRYFSNSTIEKNYITNVAGDGINMCKNPTGQNHIVQNNEIAGSESRFGSIYMYGINDVKVRNNYIHGNGHGISVASRNAQASEICSNIEISYNTISNVVASSVYSFTGLLVGGTGTSNVNFHHNYVEELAGTANYPSMVRLLNDMTNIKINNNAFIKTANLRYITFGDNNGGNAPTSSIDARCNWYGSSNVSDVTARVFNPGSHKFSPYLTSGTNTLASGGTGFEPEANACSVPCDITVTNTTINTNQVLSGNTVTIPAGALQFTSASGYDSYKWTACSGGTESSCNVTTPATSNTLTRTFTQIGLKGVKLEKTIGGDTQTCYFAFSVIPYITTSSLTSCSILLRKNGTGGTNKWFKNNTEIVGATSDTYTATENGTYTLKVTIGTDEFVSAAFEVSTIVGGISVSTQALASQTICENEIATPLTIATTPNGNAYQWYSNTTNSATGGTAITLATGTTFAPPTGIVGTMYYYATATSDNGCVAKSNVSKVVVNAPSGIAAGNTTSLVTISSTAQNITANCALVGSLVSPSIATSATPTVTITSETTVPSGIKKYIITPTAGEAFAADLVLYFSQADVDAFNAVSEVDIATSSTDAQGIVNLRILHTSTTGTETIDPTKIIWNSTESRWEISFSVTHFSTFELAAQSSSLPVTLTSFNAMREQNAAILKWTTTSETNSDHFDIQHSTNGKNWFSLGIVAAKGDREGLTPYRFVHSNPTVGENMYRLKMVDRDHTFTYSTISSVRLDSKEQITLYPNPVSDRLVIDSPQWSQINGIKLLNMQGNAVYSSKGAALQNTIDVKSFTAGTYLVEITHQNGIIQTQKIIIVR